MNTWIYINADGSIFQILNTSFAPHSIPGTTYVLQPTGMNIQAGQYYYDGTNFQSIPANTNPVYTFNYTTKTWCDQRSLAQVRKSQNAVLLASYQSAVNMPVSFTNAAGVASTYTFGSNITDAGTNVQSLLAQIISAGSAAWTAGVWADTNGTYQTMTFADLQGLAVAVEALDTPNEQDLMIKMAAVQAATTISAIEAIVF